MTAPPIGVAARLKTSHMTVASIWEKHGLQPHRLRHHLAGNEAQFEQKAADIIGIYMHPPAHTAVFCVDEKTAIQALDRLDSVLSISPVRAESHGFEIFAMAPSLLTRRWTTAAAKCWARPPLDIPARSSRTSWTRLRPANPQAKRSTSSPTISPPTKPIWCSHSWSAIQTCISTTRQPILPGSTR